MEAYKSDNIVDGKVLYLNKNRLDNKKYIKVLLMEDKFLNFKKEIEKINQRVKEYL